MDKTSLEIKRVNKLEEAHYSTTEGILEKVLVGMSSASHPSYLIKIWQRFDVRKLKEEYGWKCEEL